MKKRAFKEPRRAGVKRPTVDHPPHVAMTSDKIETLLVDSFRKYKDAAVAQVREGIIKECAYAIIDNYHVAAQVLSDVIEKLVGAPIYRVIEYVSDIFTMKVMRAMVKAHRDRLDEQNMPAYSDAIYSSIMILINKCFLYKDARLVYEAAKQHAKNDGERAFAGELLKKLDKYEYDSLTLMKEFYDEHHELYKKIENTDEAREYTEGINKLLRDNGYGYIITL